VLLQLEGDKGSPVPLRSRYVLGSGEPLKDLERHLERLSALGELRRTTVVFGVSTDPFHPFDEKFATSMRFLELFERYVPGRLVIQTRSPLVVIGLPVLKKMRAATFVTIGIETPLEEVRSRYTPELPTIDERWKTVRALRRFGLKVGVQVSPLLPYGDWRKDSEAFAEKLAEVADYLVVGSLAESYGSARPTTPLARKLALDRQFFWLRQDTHKPLTEALSRVVPEKLYHPAQALFVDKQLRLFAR
jgi:DNA repair photolyase